MKSLSLSKPHLIVMVGIAGAGKSFFAEQFAETFQAPLVSAEQIEHVLHRTTNDPKTVKVASDLLIKRQLSQLFKTKHSIIVDGSSDTRTERLEFAKLARAHHYEIMFIWVQTEPVTAKQRAIKSRRAHPHKPAISSEQYDVAVRRFTTPNTLEKPLVISGKHTYASQAKIVLRKLAEPRSEMSTVSAPPVRNRRTAGRSILIR